MTRLRRPAPSSDQPLPVRASSESKRHAHRPDYKKKRGELRIYLGAAPGVGKTFAMLGEAHRRLERGTDLVAAVVETHGRKKTADLLDGHRGHPAEDTSSTAEATSPNSTSRRC